MKNSAVYAVEVKKFFNRLKRSGPKPTLHEYDDPLKQLIYAVLSEDNSPTRAKTAMTRLLANTIDYNDLRVSTSTELASIIESDIFNAVERTSVLIEVLGSIYARENSVALNKSKTKNRRDARAYLEGLSGMTPYVLSGTMLWAFDEHAIPLDEQTLTVLKKEGLVDPDATMAEAQGFLRRHISAGDAKLFTALLKRHAAQKAPRTPASAGEPKARKRTSQP
ncbi:MAG: hypothetical protein IIB58_00155 [Planctomycetes bacterium]|nr:hypothetical protein [Planctomycetota bacterium]